MAALGQTRQGGSSVRHHGGAKARPWCRDGVRARLVMRMARHDAIDGGARRMPRPKLGPWPGQVGARGFEAARATGPCSKATKDREATAGYTEGSSSAACTTDNTGGKRRGEGGAHHSGSWRTEAARWRVDAEVGRGRAVPRGDVDAGDRGVGVVQGLQQRRPPRRARLRSGVVLPFWPFPAAPPSSPVLPSAFFLSSTLGSLCFGV